MTPQEFRIWADGFTAGRSAYTADEVQVLLNKLYSEVDGFSPSFREYIERAFYLDKLRASNPKDNGDYAGKITWVSDEYREKT